MEQFIRSSIVIGDENINKLKTKTIMVCGLGGVGSYVFEALVRMGVGHIIIVDHDIISVSNLNRQLLALHSTIGKLKVEVAKTRGLDINPNVNIEAYPVFIGNDTINSFSYDHLDYIIDAIDNVTGKLLLIEKALEYNIPIISSMGTGNKTNPLKLSLTDINKTTTCPLAKVMRYELRKRGINRLQVLASTEEPHQEKILFDDNNHPIIGSTSYVPSVAGLIIASEVIRKLTINRVEGK